MSYKKEVEGFIGDLARVAKLRCEFANCLSRTANIIQKSEVESENASGKLSLHREIEDLHIASKNLRRGIFRLLVLGDMKRG